MMNTILYVCTLLIITTANVLTVQDEVIGLMDRLSHKENPCRMGSSAYDNELCIISTGTSRLRYVTAQKSLNFHAACGLKIFHLYGKPLPSVLGVAALEHKMGVGKNRLAVGRPYSFSNL